MIPPRKRWLPAPRVVLAIILAAGSLGCSDAPFEPHDLPPLVVVPQEAELLVGEQLMLTVADSGGIAEPQSTLDDGGSRRASDTPPPVSVQWRSLDPRVAVIDADGHLRAIAHGRTTVSVSLNGRVGRSVITVTPIQVTPGSITVGVRDTVRLRAKTRVVQGEGTTQDRISWSSSSPTVALVDESGLVQAIGTGTAFIRAAVPEAARQVRVTVNPPALVGAGDIADCTPGRAEATAALLDSIPGLVFTAGDNAYPDGTLANYMDCYDPTWGRHRGRTRPALGNHEYGTGDPAGYFSYFGESAPGKPTGYYSYDYAGWHIVVLNSMLSLTAGSRQLEWLIQDLRDHNNLCTLAYWHHPWFTSGEYRAPAGVFDAWKVLYDFGAEAVINGHHHVYERFAPQTPLGRADPERGIREFVVGTGGRAPHPFARLTPNSEVRKSGAHGVLKVTLLPSSYEWEFVSAVPGGFSDHGSGTCH